MKCDISGTKALNFSTHPVEPPGPVVEALDVVLDNLNIKVRYTKHEIECLPLSAPDKD